MAHPEALTDTPGTARTWSTSSPKPHHPKGLTQLPSSETPLASANGIIAVRDVRYAIFYGLRTDSKFTLTDLVVTTGQDFFKEFRQFAGKVSNSKLQLRLPSEWFA